jgi:putative tryptophan/tyrosine transport system substrate-binding protein
MLDVRRREFITLLGGAAAAWPIAAGAQQNEQVRRMGVLMPFAMGNGEAQASSNILLQGLREFGWIEGRNLKVEYRFAGGGAEDLRTKADELTTLQMDVIVARATPTVIALAKATTTIPIVFTVVSDPVGTGFVKSWGRPGGNVTGFANFEPSIAGKWLELLKAVAPNVTRVAILFNPETAPARGLHFINPLDRAAPSLGLELVQAPVQDDSGIEDVGAKLVREPGGSIIAIPDVFTLARREQIVAMATRYGLPGAYPYSYFSKIGGLISYGADTLDLHRRAASYVDRILRGAKPADLPVQQPTKFELVINLKTARALGLEIPPTLLASADEIME